MASDIQLKRSITSGSVPDAANVLVGEPVFNLADRILYTKDSNGNIVTISSGFTSNIASLAYNAANVAASYTVAGVAGNVSNSQLVYGITSSGILTTANISELTNLYFTNTRARASISIATGNVNGKGSYDNNTGIISINAANVTVSSSVPTNPNVGDMWINADSAKEYLFFSDGDSFQWVETGLAATSSASSSFVAGVQGDVSNVQLASGISQTGILTTANVSEISNLYFTNARVYANVTQLGYVTSSAFSGYATTTNVALKANVADLKTANVEELTNLYFTNARAIAAVTNTTLSNLTISGDLSVTGSVTGTNLPSKTSGSWTVTTGTNTYSITVPASGTYQIWVRGNIPNGIIAYHATAVVTNTNVPVVGTHYAWVYNGGGSPIDFTSIPNQFIGTSNTIVRSSVAPSATTNRFDFGISNSSGSSQTVYWGYVTL